MQSISICFVPQLVSVGSGWLCCPRRKTSKSRKGKVKVGPERRKTLVSNVEVMLRHLENLSVAFSYIVESNRVGSNPTTTIVNSDSKT